MIAFALFFIANNSKFINCTYFDYTNNNNKKKMKKGFFPLVGFEPTIGQGTKWLKYFHIF